MRTQPVVPCLWFDAEAEAAASFYVSLIPDSAVTKVTRTPMDTPSGGPTAGKVLTVEFTLGGMRYVALNGGPKYRFTEAVSLQILCDDQAEVDHLWNALVDGGEPSRCGWLKDRWGLSWQIVPTQLAKLLGDPDPGRAKRAMAAMLTMDRIDIPAVERAADGR